MVRVAEIYRSLQGEGLFTGVDSVFVRASGCNLRCWYCDTPYASWEPEGEDVAVADLLERIAALGARHVVITGGEPMLFAELLPLCAELRRQERHITIETAGTLYLPVACDLMSISPKLAGSGPPPDRAPQWAARHERTRHAPEVIRRLIAEYVYQFKFVVDRPADCDEVERYLSEFPEIDRDRVLLMPQGVTREELAAKDEWLHAACQARRWKHCPRRQIEWFGHTRQT